MSGNDDASNNDASNNDASNNDASNNDPSNDPAPTCSLCGRSADPVSDGNPPLTWTADIVETADGHRTRWVCAACTRRFVRSIEAKLDRQWW